MDDAVKVDNFAAGDAPAGQGKEILHNRGRLQAAFLDRLNRILQDAVSGRQLHQQKIGIPDNAGENVVEIMCYPPCQGAQGFHLFGAFDPGFQLSLRLFGPLEFSDVADGRQNRYLAADSDLERIDLHVQKRTVDPQVPEPIKPIVEVGPRFPAVRQDPSVLRMDDVDHVHAEDFLLMSIPVNLQPGRIDIDDFPARGQTHGVQRILEERPVLLFGPDEPLYQLVPLMDR